MSAVLKYENLEDAEEIKSADLKTAHTQRIPGILHGKGVAKVTRYGKTEYYLVSPELLKKLYKHKSGTSGRIEKLRARYKKAQATMQTASHKAAFKDLAHATAGDLNASVKVGSH